MNYIRLKNIRSLKDTGKIELAPLTILLGKNSSGKSTFLRMFPLFKQSWNNKNVGALALYGDFVDFGDFDSIKSTDTKDDFIAIWFDIDIPQDRVPRLLTSTLLKPQIVTWQCEVRIKPLPKTDILYCPYIKIEQGGISIEMSLSTDDVPSDIRINNHSYKEFLKHTKFNYNPFSTCFPYFMDDIDAAKDKNQSFYFQYPGSFITPLAKRLGTGIYQKVQEFYSLYHILCMAPKKTLIDILSQDGAGEFGNILSKKLCSRYGDSCYRDIIFSLVPRLLDALRHKLSYSWTDGIIYSKPLRANAERYYRIQSLATNGIAPDGSNLISFISNMGGSVKNSFNKWIQDKFGFSIEIHKRFGHGSIFLREQDAEYNVTDMGFGFSQILPIIVQLWDISTKKKSFARFDASEFIYAVEQPELHLHPALQAKTIKLFCEVLKIAQRNDIKLRIILETHSETIINYLGRLVADKKIDHNDIKLLIFEKPLGSRTTNIKESTYTDDGILQNWPFGFFSTTQEI